MGSVSAVVIVNLFGALAAVAIALRLWLRLIEYNRLLVLVRGLSTGVACDMQLALNLPASVSSQAPP